jgi:hypothetical protein
MLVYIFLVTHALRARLYLRNTTDPEVVAIKAYIGVSKAGTCGELTSRCLEVDTVWANASCE